MRIAALAVLVSSAAAAQVSGGVVKIGVLTDLQGPYSQLAGAGSVRAAELAASDFMRKHKHLKVEVVGIDHQNKPDVATARAEEAFNKDHVDALVDLPNSGAALAASEVARKSKKVVLVVSAGSTALTNDKCSRYTFHYAFDNYMLAHGTGTAITKMGGASWYMMYPDYAFGKDLESQMRAAVEASGGKLLAPSDPVPFPSPDGDFRPFLKRAAGLHPNVFGAMQAGAELVKVVQQYNEQGLRKAGIKLAIGLLFETDVLALGAEAFAGATATVPWFARLDERALQWAQRFHDATGKWPSWAQAGVYSATMTYLEAVARAKSDDADKVVARLEGYEFEDFFARHARIRPEDHRVLLDVYHVEVKAPRAAVGEDDLFKLVATTNAENAFRPLSQSTCHFN